MPGDFNREFVSPSGSRAELILQRVILSPISLMDNLSPTANRLVFSRTSQMLIDCALVAASLCMAYFIRFDGTFPFPSPYVDQLLLALPLAIALYLTINLLSEDHKRIWRFFGSRDALALAHSVTIAFVVAITWRVFDRGLLAGLPVPFGVVILYPFLTFVALVSVRLCRRTIHSRTSGGRAAAVAVRPKRLLLIGAGEAGLMLLHELRASDFKIVGFLDDDPALRNRRVGGAQVLGTIHQLESVVRSRHVDEVILCMPSASKAVLQRIVSRCERIPVTVKSVPTLAEIMAGSVAIGQLRAVNMEQLLGRDSVASIPDVHELRASYSGRRILVTGAGGSIGSELVRQLRRFQPETLILLDKDENNLYEVACEIKEEFANVIEVIADVRNEELIEKLFQQYRPNVVFHAAAYKHVPLMEHHPAEAILNNVIGTKHVAEAAKRTGVETFVLISTDKAVNPSSMMGASKRVAEMIVQQLASASPSRTRFCCVRFGNVLGSRASVVPLFQRQISRGKNITVTHPEVRRYFMTIPEAVQLVIQAGSLGKQGEVFLLDMGDPVKIVDLARNLIELSGLVPDKDVRIEFTGLRPGEKLNEELLVSGEEGVRTKYSKIFVVEALVTAGIALDQAVAALEKAAQAGDVAAIYTLVKALNIGYQTPAYRAPHARRISDDTYPIGRPVQGVEQPGIALAQRIDDL